MNYRHATKRPQTTLFRDLLLGVGLGVAVVLLYMSLMLSTYSAAMGYR